MENSKIEWTNHTFNPWIGCTKVSPGCLNCYAETLMDTRHGRVKWGKGQPRSRTGADNWRKPKAWNKVAEGAAERPRVFCASLADWLDDEVPIEWLADLLNLIEETPNLDWLLLSKRPENWYSRVSQVDSEFAEAWTDCIDMPERGGIPHNVWIGTSAEDQPRWDERIPQLSQIPAVTHFVSAEPLLGPIVMTEYRPDWLIVGGESGQGARLMQPNWVEDLLAQCDDKTAFHFKQWGGVNKKAAGRLLHDRTWDDFPKPKTSKIIAWKTTVAQ